MLNIQNSRLGLGGARTLMFISVLVLSACGSGSPDPVSSTPSSILNSALVLTAPPETCSVGSLGAWTWDAEWDEDEVWFDGPGSQQSTLTVPGTGVLWADTVEVSGVVYFLAGALRADESFAMYRYHDAGTDGAPDDSTETLLFSTGTDKAYITSFSMDETTSRGFALDRRCQDVLLVVDTDSDDWPDDVLMVPFARSNDYSSLLATRYLMAFSGDKIATYNTTPRVLSGTYSQPSETYEDSNSDNVADTTQADSADSKHPVADLDPYAGQTSISLRSHFGASGKTAEIWKLDASGNDVSMLGSTVLTGTDGVGAGVAALSPALVLDDYIGVRFNGEATDQSVLQVGEAWPQMQKASPSQLQEGVAATVTLYGANFTSTMDLKLMKPDGSVQSQAFTFVSSSEITVSLPALTNTTYGKRASLWASIAGQDDEEDGAFTVSLFVAD